jgi:hypothetical protein
MPAAHVAGMTNFDPAVHPRDIRDGVFIDRVHTPAEITLAPNDTRAARRAALTAAGYIPATAGTSDGRVTINRWWNTRFTQAEYRVGDSGYPQMPDDFTPSDSTGSSLSGRRRTQRMTYTSEEVSVTMPSAAAIRRYSYENGGTFDVPVSATFPGGNVSGWVRVTQNGANTWSVQGLNFPDADPGQVAEAISAVLEARRPSTALQDAGDLLARRAERIAAGGEKIQAPPHESFIIGAGYDHTQGVLAVKIGAKLYGYTVTPERVRLFGKSTSVGAAYNRLLKGQQVAEVHECDKCHRFNVGAVTHRCPSQHNKPNPTQYLQNTAARQKVFAAKN